MRPSVRILSCQVLALAIAALAAAAGQAASDCFAPLRASAGWRCHADVPGGQAVDYCLEHTNAFGNDPASRFFKLIATGPYPAHCSCQAKGKLPGAAFGEDASFLCLYRDTDAVVSGKLTKRRMTGQTFSAAYGVRTVFRCEPDPACDVPAVVDPDLTPESGALDLVGDRSDTIDVAGGGSVPLGYLAGCGGYASEAPTFSFRTSTASGSLAIRFGKKEGEADEAGLLVVTPSGGAYCANYELEFPSPQPGAYTVWLRSKTPGALVEGYLSGYHDVP